MSQERKPEVTREVVRLEGSLFGGSRDISLLRFAEKDSFQASDIPAAQKLYNEKRKQAGLEPVVDWTKRPEVTFEQKLREQLAKPPTPKVTPDIIDLFKQEYIQKKEVINRLEERIAGMKRETRDKRDLRSSLEQHERELENIEVRLRGKGVDIKTIEPKPPASASFKTILAVGLPLLALYHFAKKAITKHS